MDANGTRFFLLQGEGDWFRGRTIHGVPAFPESHSPPTESLHQVRWDDARQEVTLWQEAFRFIGSKHERPVDITDRRGAARDQFGNWYWIAPDRHSILVWSSGTQVVSTFWPVACGTKVADVEDGSFRPSVTPSPAQITLHGLAVTEDHYLVAGSVGGARGSGLVVFDLYSVGPPRERLWPVAFEPFDLAPREGGGVWVLDRTRHRVWEIDRRFEVVVVDPGPPPGPDGAWFTCADSGPGKPQGRGIHAKDGWVVPAGDPIAVVALPGAGVAVLDRDGGDRFARVHWLKNGAAYGAPASTRAMLDLIGDDLGTAPFTLVAHDFTFGAPVAGDPTGWIGRLYVVGLDGNQSFAFGVSLEGDRLNLHPRPEFFPMRLFGGRGLVTAADEPYYDCGDLWVRLLAQDRPRYVEEGELWTPVFDSGEPGCVWHRLMLDACIPPGAGVEVSSRASDDWRDLTLVEWLDDRERRALGVTDDFEPGAITDEADLARWESEPTPRPRGDGPELPFLRAQTAGRSTFELLFQRARGRYLQVKLVLHGDGRSTPRIGALRAWYPRFSYLDRYLPAVYREDTASASFLDRFLANFEGMLTTIEDRIAAAQILFDVASAPPDALDWLGTWFGVAMDPSWDERKRRLFIRHAMDFFAMRGTVRGLQVALRLAFDDCADDRLFTETAQQARATDPIRIIEGFRARRTPPALLGDVGTAVPRPQWIDPASRWTPQVGGAELSRRYRQALGLSGNAAFPLVSASSPAGWAEFAQQTLGFVPSAGRAERTRWQTFLQNRGVTTSGNLPADEPSGTAWSDFLKTPNRQRTLWHDFLARRYRTIAALNAAWGKQWSRFGNVALHDRLPQDGAPLADWFQFESTVLAMHRTAHRFTVMLPASRKQRIDSPNQQRRLALAKAVLDLEKPAHTTYDVRFYWAMFRLGEARLGDDTLIDLGSRSPELMGPMVLGQGSLSEAFLADRAANQPIGRYELGRDRVGRSGPVGGP